MRTPIEYNRFSFVGSNDTRMLNCVVEVPYGTKEAYVQAGWVGEGDDGTQVVKQVVEAEPEPVNFDLNNDSKIDIGDVTKLVNEVLKQHKP